MVIILTGAAGDGKAPLARVLATEVGWAFVDADDNELSPATLHTVVARALDRREHTVIACAPLHGQERLIVRGDLHPVRFVTLQPAAVDAPSASDGLAVDAAWPPERILDAIRREFGV